MDKNKPKILGKHIAKMGKELDHVIAAQVPCSANRISVVRRSLGIPRAIEPQIIWTPQMDAPLGKEYDYVVAKRHFISVFSVCTRRRKLGIPPLGNPVHASRLGHEVLRRKWLEKRGLAA